MNIKNKIRLAVDFFLQNLFYNILLISLITITLLLFAISLLYYHSVRYCRTSADDALADGIDNTYQLYLGENDFSDPKAAEFRKRLFKNKDITAIGSYGYYGMSYTCFEPLRKIQKDNVVHDSYYKNKELEVLTLTKEIFPLCNLALEEGQYPDEYENSDEYHIPLYLGNAYQGVDVGTIYEQRIGNHLILEYEVMGVLKRGEKFISEEVNHLNRQSVRGADNLDYAVIICTEDASTSLWNISCKNEVREDVFGLIKKTAEELGIEYEIAELKAAFDKVDKENEEFLEITLGMAVFMFFVLVTVIVSRQTVEYLNRRKEFGILCSQGISMSDIGAVMRMEICVRLAIAYGIFAFISYLCSGYLFHASSAVREVVYEIIVERVLIVCGIIVAACGMVSALVSVILLKGKSPVELMEENTIC